ncbi:hypothetical protein R3P38DRAFT_544389 [Favolaschia claudopus]|uniref:DUF6534 domain-containing protein n=1 Tax=Favolaschia claudopus TaxID=2862362 RepID=A0AAW0CHY4_9AGAR
MNPEIGKITIPIFIGTVINWCFLGVLCVQVYLYFLAFPRDRWQNKFIVLFVFCAEIIETFGDSRDAIVIFGSHWGDPDSLDKVGLAWFSVPVIGSTIAFVGQVFFAWRISIVGGGVTIVPALIVAISAFQYAAGIWSGVEISRVDRFSSLQFNQFKIPLSVETGVLCAICAIVTLALYVAFDGNNYHLTWCIWLSKAYSNSILVILNSRAHLGPSPPSLTTANLTDMTFSSHPSRSMTSTIRITVETDQTVDSRQNVRDKKSEHIQHSV